MASSKPARTILDRIGDTPAVELVRVARGLPAEVWAKVEYLNPGGSAKDRVALSLVLEAEASGSLEPGDTIVEASAGNTGIGFALVAAVRGYKCIIVVPRSTSREKVAVLRAYGAEVVLARDDVEATDRDGYVSVADRIAASVPRAYRPHQFSNPSNPETHYRLTAAEIWRDLDGRVDGFVCTVGTGGTWSGIGRYLRERNPAVALVWAVPADAESVIEGLVPEPPPPEFRPEAPSATIAVTDSTALEMARRLAREEGLLVGGSAGAACAAALEFARSMGAGSRLSVLLPDTGRNYLHLLAPDPG